VQNASVAGSVETTDSEFVPTKTIALELERDRLQHRLERLRVVVAALHDRAVYRQAVSGATPVPLRQVIEGFETETAAVCRRLNELPPGTAL
jgi:hypothetical protein